MADQVNNPGGPQNRVPALKDLATLLNKVSETLTNTEKTSESINKKYKEWGSELRQVIAFADDIEESTKHLFDYQKKMAREGLKAKDYKEVLDLLREMEKHNETSVKKGAFSKQHTQIIERQTENIRKAVKRRGAEVNNAFDPELVEDVMVPLVRMNKLTLDLAKNMKGIRINGLTQDVHGAQRALRHLFQRPGSSQMEKYHQIATVGREILKARKDRAAGRLEMFKQRRERIESSLPALNIDKSKYRRSDGTFDRTAYNRDKEATGFKSVR